MRRTREVDFEKELKLKAESKFCAHWDTEYGGAQLSASSVNTQCWRNPKISLLLKRRGMREMRLSLARAHFSGSCFIIFLSRNSHYIGINLGAK